MDKFEIMKELETVERKLYSSLESRDYFVSDGYVKRFNDSLSDIFIDIKIRGGHLIPPRVPGERLICGFPSDCAGRSAAYSRADFDSGPDFSGSDCFHDSA